MSASEDSLRNRLSQSLPPTLRLRARVLADGLLTGGHRASKRGAGIEFAEHRAYTPGDDLRHLDSHALLRHGRLLIRQFQAETERVAYIVVDNTASMAYRGPDTSLPSKAEHALLLAGALCYTTQRGGDAVGLSLFDKDRQELVPAGAGASTLARVFDLLENAERDARASEVRLVREVSDPAATAENAAKTDTSGGSVEHSPLDRLLSYLTARLPSGAIVFFISDFLQHTPQQTQLLAGLCSRGRTVRAVQVLTPSELNFPFEGPARFIDPETGRVIQTDAGAVRARYHQALNELTAGLQERLLSLGGQLLRLSTADELRRVLPPLVLGQDLAATLLAPSVTATGTRR